MDAKKISEEYYAKKFGSSVEKAFIHFTKEVGEFARAIEKENPELAKLEITEMVALLFYVARQYDLDVLRNVEEVYRKKMESK